MPGSTVTPPSSGEGPGTDPGTSGGSPSSGSPRSGGSGSGPTEFDANSPAPESQGGNTSGNPEPDSGSNAGGPAAGGANGGEATGTQNQGAENPGIAEGPGETGATGSADGPPATIAGGSQAGGPVTWGPLASALATLGVAGPTFPALSVAPTLVTTTGTVAMAMAFGIFGKRRRDGEPPAPDEQLAAAAATGVVIAVPTVEDEAAAAEALLPRWRRPSLLQARKADPIRDAAPAPRLTFDNGLVGPLDGHERRMIRYRVVRMLDAPDELRGTEIGYLDRGDEVQLVQKQGAYWLVLCPDGRQGWVHNMTLGETIEELVQPDRPVATMPLAAETWTMGESDDDTDVLEAYLESRRRES